MSIKLFDSNLYEIVVKEKFQPV